MKVWPIDPLVPRNLRLEVPEKLPQGSGLRARAVPSQIRGGTVGGNLRAGPRRGLVEPSTTTLTGRLRGVAGRRHTWMRGTLVRLTVRNLAAVTPQGNT